MSPCLLSSILHDQDKKKLPRSNPTKISPCDKLSIQSTCHPLHSLQFHITKIKSSRLRSLLEVFYVTSCLTVNMSPCLLSSILHNQDKKKSPRSHPTGNSQCDKLSIQSTVTLFTPLNSTQSRLCWISLVTVYTVIVL